MKAGRNTIYIYIKKVKRSIAQRTITLDLVRPEPVSFVGRGLEAHENPVMARKNRVLALKGLLKHYLCDWSV